MTKTKTLASAVLVGGFAGLVIFTSMLVSDERKEREWKQNLLDERRREFMDQMERKHS